MPALLWIPTPATKMLFIFHQCQVVWNIVVFNTRLANSTIAPRYSGALPMLNGRAVIR